MDNTFTVNLYCDEIGDKPLVSIIVDLDKVTDPHDVHIPMTRAQLAHMGELAQWAVSDE